MTSMMALHFCRVLNAVFWMHIYVLIISSHFLEFQIKLSWTYHWMSLPHYG